MNKILFFYFLNNLVLAGFERDLFEIIPQLFFYIINFCFRAQRRIQGEDVFGKKVHVSKPYVVPDSLFKSYTGELLPLLITYITHQTFFSEIYLESVFNFIRYS